MWVNREEWYKTKADAAMYKGEYGKLLKRVDELDYRMEMLIGALLESEIVKRIGASDFDPGRGDKKFNALCDWLGVEWSVEHMEGFKKKNNEGT